MKSQKTQKLTISKKKALIQKVFVNARIEALEKELRALKMELDQKEEVRKKSEFQIEEKVKESFVRPLAHELNNLLFPIVVYSEMIQKGLAANDINRKKLLRINESAKRTKRFVDSLLKRANYKNNGELRDHSLFPE